MSVLGTAEKVEKQVSSMPAYPAPPAIVDNVSPSCACRIEGSMFDSSILFVLLASSLARSASSVNGGRPKDFSGDIEDLVGDCVWNFEGGKLTSSMKGELGGPEGLVGTRFSSVRWTPFMRFGERA